MKKQMDEEYPLPGAMPNLTKKQAKQELERRQRDQKHMLDLIEERLLAVEILEESRRIATKAQKEQELELLSELKGRRREAYYKAYTDGYDEAEKRFVAMSKYQSNYGGKLPHASPEIQRSEREKKLTRNQFPGKSPVLRILFLVDGGHHKTSQFKALAREFNQRFSKNARTYVHWYDDPLENSISDVDAQKFCNLVFSWQPLCERQFRFDNPVENFLRPGETISADLLADQKDVDTKVLQNKPLNKTITFY